MGLWHCDDRFSEQREGLDLCDILSLSKCFGGGENLFEHQHFEVKKDVQTRNTHGQFCRLMVSTLAQVGFFIYFGRTVLRV